MKKYIKYNKIYNKQVNKKIKSLKCNKINVQTYNLLIDDESTWYFLKFAQTVFPFSDFYLFIIYFIIKYNKTKRNFIQFTLK